MLTLAFNIGVNHYHVFIQLCTYTYMSVLCIIRLATLSCLLLLTNVIVVVKVSAVLFVHRKIKINYLIQMFFVIFARLYVTNNRVFKG